MNANELADWIENGAPFGKYETAKQAVVMLRQQQAEIEALKMDIHSLTYGERLAKHFNKPVAWRSKDTDGHWNIYQSPVEGAEPLYTHPADLTDEEILDAWNDEWVELDKDEMFIEFARAILRKAQEK